MYRETRLPGIGVLWYSSARSGDAVIPADGCADLILRDDELIVAGPSTRWLLASGGEDPRTVGIRFAPGLAGAGLGRPPAELRDRVVPAADAVDRVVRERGSAVLRALRAELLDGPGDPLSAPSRASLVRAVGDGLGLDSNGSGVGAPTGLGRASAWIPEARRSAAEGEPFAALAARLGYSERQLHRRMLERFGYGHAALRRVLRAGRARAALRAGATPTAAAQNAGYSDQAHLTREFARLVGTTPGRFIAGLSRTATNRPASQESGA